MGHPPDTGEARDKLNALGIEAFCDLIIDGVTMSQIACDLNINRSQVTRWIAADKDRAAQSDAARRFAARTWDERAELELKQAGTAKNMGIAERKFELARAEALAHHYRWRASKIDPGYGANPHEEADKNPADKTLLTTAQRLRALVQEIDKVTDGTSDTPMDGAEAAPDAASVLEQPASV
jgi:hypothetical protein